MRSLARSAGVSHAAPAHHFGDVNGLMTALASEGFSALEELVETSEDPSLAYVDFALRQPQLFRLMFVSPRPDFTNAALRDASNSAFKRFLHDVGAKKGLNRTQLLSEWSRIHGLSMLVLSGRMRSVALLEEEERLSAVRAILSD